MTESDFMNLIDPMVIVQKWLNEASEKAPGPNPNAMTLATVNAEGQPSTRVVLAKELSTEGIIFYTNYKSKKALELAENAKASVNFHWDYLLKQVKVSGTCEKTSREQAVQYWQSRPRGSQISQYISQQSSVVSDRNKLVEMFEQAKKQFANQEVPCPENWGGYLLKPELVELWLADPDRLHDRFEYRRTSSGWLAQRLFP